MKEAIFLLAGLSLGLTLRAQSSRSGTAVDAGHKKPRLVVGIVVDQMRWDYLRRYEARYGQEGFGRLQREGFSFDDCRINYLPAVTAAGHAALFTGSVPALNGIVGNDFYVEGTLTYCTSDPTVCGVGTASAQGAMSPRHLLPTTVTDELVGRGQYLLFLTADHGGSHNVLYRQRHRLPSMLYEPEKVQASLDSLLWRLDPKADGVRLVRSMNAYQVHLDDRRLDSLQIDLTAAIAAVCRYLESQPWIAYAFDLRHMPDYVPEPIRQMAVNGYNPQRGGDIQLILQSGATKAYKPGALRLKGAEHAVWNPDDTHIPFILMGCGIRPGADGQVCYITDIAPTISMLLGIQRPSAAVGQSLLERVCE